MKCPECDRPLEACDLIGVDEVGVNGNEPLIDNTPWITWDLYQCPDCGDVFPDKERPIWYDPIEETFHYCSYPAQSPDQLELGL